MCLPGHVAIEIDLSDVAARAKEGERETDTETGGFHQWRYSHYFQFIAQKDKNICVKRALCAGGRCLSTSAKSMSNLSEHLSAQHGNTSFEGVTQQPPRLNKQSFSQQVLEHSR